MFCYRVLTGASTLVLVSALSAIPSTTKAQTADRTLPPVTVDAPREVRARPAGAKATRSQFLRPATGEATRGYPYDRFGADQERYRECGACESLPSAGRTNRDDNRSKPVRQQARIFGRRRVARQPRHLGKAGQRTARFGHFD